jgi:hypothetical protein
MDTSQASTELGLTFKAQLPLRWRVIEDIENYNAPNNSRFLNILPVLEEPESHSQEHKAPNAELARLETKLDLVLEMLGEVFQQRKPLPRQIPFQISANGMTWLDEAEPPEKDSYIELQVYLSPQLFVPLALSAQVSLVEDMGNVYRVQAKFLPMEESLQEWLEKYIFRQHRRRVAQQHQRHDSS